MDSKTKAKITRLENKIKDLQFSCEVVRKEYSEAWHKGHETAMRKMDADKLMRVGKAIYEMVAGDFEFKKDDY